MSNEVDGSVCGCRGSVRTSSVRSVGGEKGLGDLLAGIMGTMCLIVTWQKISVLLNVPDIVRCRLGASSMK